ncbi:MAG: AAA family ATPase [Planctomycetaceae bacterium]|nr:AAA family ATPase [Planctomycetaceae bacterium]
MKLKNKMDDIAEFISLIHGGYACISVVTNEEFEMLDIVRRAAAKLEYPMQIWSAGLGIREGLHPLIPSPPKQKSPEAALAAFQDGGTKTFYVMLDLSTHLSNTLVLRALRDAIHRIAVNKSHLILIDSEDKLPDVIRSYARTFEMSLPGREELDTLVRTTLREIHNKTPLEIGITRDGLEAVIRNLRGLSIRQAHRLICDAVCAERRFDDADVNTIIAGKRRMIQSDGLLEYVQAPLTMEEIGGMDNLKRWLKLRKDAFTEQAAQFGITPPRGILILGVQGSGKSLCAKAIATAWQQPLYRLDCGTLYNSYVGESERNLRKALRQIEAMSPAILWIDEIEKAFASAASQSTDGGLSKRMFATLLTWMQEHREAVFLVATANEIEALPPELLRKGRVDEIFFVNLPNERARRQIIKIHLLKRKRDPKHFDLDALAKAAEGSTGSEIEQAVISALHEAFDSKTELTTAGIVAALRSSPPLSVTMAESVAQLCAWANGRCVPAD